MTRNKRLWTSVVLVLAFAASALGVAAAERFVLVSAQVVTATDRPSVLRVLANGPIAFKVVPAEEAGGSAGDALVVDLFGVDAGALSGTQAMDEFVLSVQPGPAEATRLTVAGPPHDRQGGLVARLGTASHVLEICRCAK